jgi:CBS domain-containing protein
MALNYRVIEIYTAEEMRHGGKPLYEALVAYVKGLKIAARCFVTRAMAGCYESGEIASRNILTISYNLPVKVEIILPAAEAEKVLPNIEAMVEDGIVAVREMTVQSYRTRKNLIPRQIRVRDIMTPDPQRVTRETPASEVVGILLPAAFSGLPVVDRTGRPLGIITQGDLIYRGGMPLRLGLLAASESHRRDQSLAALAGKQAGDVMTRPAVTITEDRPVTEGVDLMLGKKIKRLPVVNENGVLAGMLSRLDVFRTITRETPHWESIRRHDVTVENLRYVADIMRRDTQTVAPDAPAAAVIRIIDTDDIQRVAVVDANGQLLGLISDHDLLSAFAGRGQGFWEYLACRVTHRGREDCPAGLRKTLQEKTAADVMQTDLVMVGENTSVEEAVELMVAHRLKRLPVVDADGRFRGMISREGLLAGIF